MDKSSTNVNPVIVIGCGGIGAWVIQALDRTLPKETQVILFDKDKIEERNLDRQLFSKRDIGRSKAKAMSQKLARLENVIAVDDWFQSTTEIPENSIVFCCADNHRARFFAREAVARTPGAVLIVGANEYTDAEAYFFKPEFAGSPVDMLSFYPEIATDLSGSPTEHCTGIVQETNPQLAISNMLAAGYMMWFYWFWTVEMPKLKDFPLEETPIKVSGNFSRIRTTLFKEIFNGNSGTPKTDSTVDSGTAGL